MPTFPSPVMHTDIARRILTQRLALVPLTEQDRQTAMATIREGVQSLSTGVPANASEARDALLAQQLNASADILSLADLAAEGDKAGITLSAQQTLAKVLPVIGENPSSMLVGAFDELPETLRNAVTQHEQQHQIHRPH